MRTGFFQGTAGGSAAGDGCLYAGGTYREAQGVDRKGQLVEAYAFFAEVRLRKIR